MIVVVAIFLDDLKDIVFYSHETQFRHTECDICAITKYILVHTV